MDGCMHGYNDALKIYGNHWICTSVFVYLFVSGHLVGALSPVEAAKVLLVIINKKKNSPEDIVQGIRHSLYLQSVQVWSTVLHMVLQAPLHISPDHHLVWLQNQSHLKIERIMKSIQKWADNPEKVLALDMANLSSIHGILSDCLSSTRSDSGA